MQSLANLNGKQMPLAEAVVPALDRGFLFGDAVYEVLRVYGGRPWLLEQHWQRLARSLDAIRIGGVDLDRLRRRLLETIAAGSFTEAVAYIQITRGAGPTRSHVFPTEITPLEFLYVQPFADAHVAARERGIAAITLPDLRWDLCDIKSTNLLANVLAGQAAKEAGCDEALLYLPDGTLTEGTRTSVFGVLDGQLLTMPASHAILPGITRALVLRLAERANVPVRNQSLVRDDLPRVSELFLTGTGSEVLGIVRVDGQTIGDGRPGPITRRLEEAYRHAVRDFLLS